MINDPIQENSPSGIPLGRQIAHSETYDPSQLFCVARKDARKTLGINTELPFFGVDIWNAYELSWLDQKGKPCVAMGEIMFSSTGENIIESKSLKLYLNSFNFTRFESTDKVKETIIRDLSGATVGDVAVNIFVPRDFAMLDIKAPRGICIDLIEIKDDIDQYTLDPSYLKTDSAGVEETLFSNLLRTNCPVTGQPDWATVKIDYKGNAMDHEGLLRYIISLRQHQGFHENCVELIFMDILHQCAPDFLSVQARFTRRGGLDINPCRSSHEIPFSNIRLARQ
ncbi:7-cyano-7-deazaguanine reductase [Desulfocicer vacuolatum DSM 3385]|uniref:7-cyano-7-deazaguanine reductase n=1 Tax=Desulfocicer vacuolatum DSM 3385 TaxID=1121400 RepID=A0A1W2A6X4_9BACT|nr:NADPH-dependent 7-cyano-7-deazaguanine reductase QueF [Desulfocicer vacuolatum]SMC56455.1 7-cyano-7-deazaguanine reductase [Desulfocicer vacuolatum DSM 3385]